MIDRSIRISKKYGNEVGLAGAYYDAAWTIYWWYTDLNDYYEYYQKYEKIAMEERNVHLFSNWITLWINLYALSIDRTEPSFEKRSNIKKKKIGEPKRVFQESPEDFNLNFLSNENIYTDSLINISLWDHSGWSGIMFIADTYEHSFPPILSLIFEKDAGKQILEEWKGQFGEFDINDKIAIRIIKNIDKKHPYWYRVVVGTSNPIIEGNAKLVACPARVHTMMPDNDRNLVMFETELKRASSYEICPCVWQDKGKTPPICRELSIHKNRDSIVICNAYEVTEDDILFFSGILPVDRPLIPKGREDAPILKIIERKMQMVDRHKNL